jgi:hypothetical protein
MSYDRVVPTEQLIARLRRIVNGSEPVKAQELQAETVTLLLRLNIVVDER